MAVGRIIQIFHIEADNTILCHFLVMVRIHPTLDTASPKVRVNNLEMLSKGIGN